MEPSNRLLSLVIVFIFPFMGLAQNTADVALNRYTNASLGFNIDLPCTPEQSASDSAIMLTCERTPYSIMISSSAKRVKDDLEFDGLVSSLMLAENERMSIQGHMARRMHITEGGRQWVILFVAMDDRVLLFSFGSSTDAPLDPRILSSLVLH